MRGREVTPEDAPGRLILAGVPWVTSRFPTILVGYQDGLSCLVQQAVFMFLGPHIRLGRVQ
jgi:hypothetical protein